MTFLFYKIKPSILSKKIAIYRFTEVNLQFCNLKLLAHTFASRIWRWHDITKNTFLIPLNTCRCYREAHSTDLCINPFHYDRYDAPGIHYFKKNKISTFNQNKT